MSDVERLNFYRLSLLIMDGGTPTLKWLFEKQYTAIGDLEMFLKSQTPVLDVLQKKKIINQMQMDLLRPSTGIKPSVENFDTSLLITLLTNICPRIQQPSGGWAVSPAASDLCTEADILRLRDARNKLFHHAKCGISDAEFHPESSNVSAAILRLSSQLNQQQQVIIQKIISDARQADRDSGREKEICNLIFADTVYQMYEMLQRIDGNLIFADKIDEIHHWVQGIYDRGRDDKIDQMYEMLQRIDGVIYDRGRDAAVTGLAVSEASHSLLKDEKCDGTKDQPDIDMHVTFGENSIIVVVKLYADLKKELTREMGMSIAKVLLKEENSTDALEEIEKASTRRLCIDSLLKRVIHTEAATVQSFLMEIKSKCPKMAKLLAETIITEEDRREFQLIDDRVQTNGRICSRVQTLCGIDESDVKFFQRRLYYSPENVDKIADLLLSKFHMSFSDHSKVTLHSDVFTKIRALFETIRSYRLDAISELESVLGSKLYKEWIEFRNETSGPNGENMGIWQSIIQRICGTAASLMESVCQTFHIDFIRSERGSLVLTFLAGDNFSIELLKPESVKKELRELLEKTCPEHHPLFKDPVHVTIFIKSAEDGEKEEIHFFLETIKDRKEIEDGHSCFGRHERDYMIEEMDPEPLKQWMFEKLQIDECTKIHLEDIISWNDIGREEKMKILIDTVERFEDGYKLLQRYSEKNDKFVYDKVFQKARQQSRTDQQTELGYEKGEGMQKLFSTWIDFSEDPKGPVAEMDSVETDLMTEESPPISGQNAFQTFAEYSSHFAPSSSHTFRTASSHSDRDELDVDSSEVNGQKPSHINVKKMEAIKELLLFEERGDKSAPGIQEKGDKEEENKGIEIEDDVEKMHHLQSQEFEPIAGKKGKDARNDDDANRESHESSNEERAVLKEQGVRIEDLQGEALIQEMRAEASIELDTSIKGGAIINEHSIEKDEQREPTSDQVEAREVLAQKPQEKESTQELFQKAFGAVKMVGQPESQEPSREFETSKDNTPEEGKTQEEKAEQDKGAAFEIEITEVGGQVQAAVSLQSKQLIKEIAKTDEAQANEREGTEEETAVVDNVEGQKEEDENLENDNVGGEQEKENDEKSIEDDQESKVVAETSQSRKAGFSKSKQKHLRKQEKKQRDKKIEASQGEKHSKRKTKNTENLQTQVKDKKKPAGATGIETPWFRDENYITIHFRVLVSPDFKLDLKEDKVLIKTKLKDFGDFESNENHMQHVRHVKEFHEMLISLNIKREIAFEKGFCYRYAVLHEKNDSDKVECEYYYKAGWTSLTADRYFLLSDEWKNKKEFHRFDGIMNPDKTRLARMIDKVNSNYTKKLTEDAEMSTRIFAAGILLPTEKRSAKLNKETMETLGMLLSGLESTYWLDAKCWSSGEELKQTMSDVLLSPILKSLGSETPLTDFRETPQNAERRMHQALFVLIVTEQYKLQLSSNYMPLLARSLLLRPHHETRELHDYAVVDNYFSNDKEKLKMILIDFCNNFPVSDKDPSWLHCIPLLHMISGDVRPYQSPSADDKHDSDYASWCGIRLIRNTVEKFQENPTTWLIPLQEMIRILTPVFELDFFFPRTLMAALRLHEVEEVMRFEVMPPEVCIAACTNYIKYTRPMLRDGVTAVRDEDKEMVRCLNELWKYLEKFEKPEYWSEECLCKHAQLTYKTAGHMVTTTLKEIHMKELHNLVAAVIQVFLRAIAFYDNIRVNIETSESQPYIDMLKQICNQIRSDWLNQMFCLSHQRDLKETFSAWSSLLSPDDLKSPTIAQMWNDEILQDFRHRLEQQLHSCPTDGENFVQFYCTEMDTLHHRLQTCLSDLAFEAVETGYMVECTDFDRRQMERFGDLLSHLFESQWISRMAKEDVHKDHVMLAFMLDWPPFSHFMELFTGDKKIHDFLGSDCISHLKSCISLLKSLISVLLTGHVALEDLDLIQSAEEKFLDLGKRLQGLEEHKTEEDVDIPKAVKGRQKEVDCYRSQIEQIKILLNLCQYIPSVDTSSVQKRLLTLSASRRLCVVDICESVSVDIWKDLQAYKPRIKAFELPQLVLMNLDKLESQYQSRVFLRFWEETGKMNKVNSLEKLFSHVWIPVNEKWLTICTEIASGHITFERFEQCLGKLSLGDDYGCIDEEMTFLKVEVKTRKERLEQLRQHRHLGHCIHGAKIILQIAHALALKGDFGDIKKIASKARGGKIKMQDFDTSLMQTCALLQEMTTKRSACLEAVIKSEKLLKWLKESMKGGMKELKVFVDLASISAGDGDMEIDKVNCLHAAITGYAPLVFDLDANSGYKALRERCNLVWEALEADPALPQKLESISHQLSWLQSVKQAHGSVEVASLEQASAINADGIYCVGKLEAMKENELCLDLHKVISLTVTSEQKKRQYSFDQLQDLQNRLMLVAGKAEHGKDNVERFTMVFDSVTRLANVYNKLISAGCVLYTNWQARFFCRSRPLKSLCANIQFGEGLKAFQVCISEAEDITTIIPEIARFMENCLEKWLDYINEKRNKYFELNFFTTDQLVILQQELAEMGTGQDPDIKIYPLLSAVKESCTYEDLEDAMQRASKDVEEVQMAMDEDKRGKTEAVRETVKDEEWKLNRHLFIEGMMNSSHTELAAMDASKHLLPDQIVEDVVREKNLEELWVVGQEEMKEAEATKLSLEGWTNSVTSPTAVTGSSINKHERARRRSENTKTLIKDLEHLWETFLGSISSRVKGSLSVEHLGLVLRWLASKVTLKIFRPFPPELVQGVPNLIVCHKAHILRTLLSVYMLDSTQPLPQADEVLMCDSHTTLDQLDVFWRRSLVDRSSRIHCLVNADLLDFEVSDRGERYLQNYMQQVQNKDYHLIVICSLENEYQSRMVTALEKYRRQLLPVSNEKIASYIKEKLQVDIIVPKANFKPAAVVDPDRSCVRVVKSTRAGVGKSLYVKRRVEDLSSHNQTRGRQCHVIVPLQDREINISKVTQILLSYMQPLRDTTPRIFHLDLSHEVQEGVDCFLFSLLILGCLTDSFGHVWRRSARDLYLVETMPIMERRFVQERRSYNHVHKVFEFLPFVICRSPKETVDILAKRQIAGVFRPTDQLFDEKEFESPTFQRPYYYLSQLDQRQEGTTANPSEVLKVLLRHCGVPDPSWAELHHFVWFLDTQLRNFENSTFCSSALANDLPGFQGFVLRFLIQMSKDFSTRSLIMAEESPTNIAASLEDDKEMKKVDDLAQFQLRRRWESSPHPYLFFNPDGQTMTFVGFNIDQDTGNLVDHQTGRVLEKAIMSRKLYKGLKKNRVPIQEDFDHLSRMDKITRLRKVMGNEFIHDPDETYELTTDNVKKILAIYMRFRCDIPVIIMGETGCGKTRLVKFLCALQTPPGAVVKNMVLMKVHGGVTNADIIKKVQEAEKLAQENAEKYGSQMYTVLFFDEANTTESIGLIKEILCDKSMEGRQLRNCPNLKMVAACNPYRKHSKELIRRLEQAGLGYHVDAEKTIDRLGRVPMRNLVYRVQPLPQSLLPLVWDFGQLNTQTEDIYIKQMIIRYISQRYLPYIPGLVAVISGILTASQDFMRQQKDECSFVSLRDIDRVLSVMTWFYRKDPVSLNIFPDQDSSSDTERDEEEEAFNRNSGITWSLVLALGVCYLACLKKRKEYTEHIWKYFKPPLKVLDGPTQIEDTVIRCQDFYLDNVHLDKNIARNTALKENVFMMVVCAELRIPLFLVGKPGSSKSLAKTIVADAMQGNAARVDLFREFKQIQMVSFQCSPLSTPDGIVGTFRQCAKFQKDKDLDKFVSVVVLDEVGLAEDSPRMPLKTLHPLLEDGCQGDEEPEPYKKVAFIGISNWALDPAKMNRGILVQRDVPDLQELENSAKGICSSDATTLNLMKPLIKPLAKSYLQLFTKASKDLREFYGLRDFYSLIKMIYFFCEKSKKVPTWHQLLHAIKRNFGGLNSVNPVETFTKRLSAVVKKDAQPQPGDPDCSPTGLIHACFDVNKSQCESRYLLLLTENYGALTILQQQILNIQDAIIIFGSSFPSDQKYTQVCRNINRIKVCMETGNTVVLLNLENLYESLYDALNQYYVYFGGDRYVDLGLGTHRVKCRVHKNFRLIVVAEKEVVYQKFPIPLINRLEKHFLTVNTLLTPEQGHLAERLEKWAHTFSTETTSLSEQSVNHGRGQRQRSVGDVFIGCHTDTYSAIILFVWEDLDKNERKLSKEKVLDESKKLLLWSATPEAVVRLGKCYLPHHEVEAFRRTYWEEQTHDNLAQYLQHKLGLARMKKKDCFAQVTTHSRLLSQSYREDISKATEIPECRLLIEALQSFVTEQQFSRKIRSFINEHPEEELLILIQCDSGDTNSSLVACARYCILDVHQHMKDRRTAPCHVVFIIQLPRIAGGCFTGFQCGLWHSVHIDDLRVQSSDMPTIQGMMGVSIATLLERAITSKAARKVPTETNKMGDRDVPEEVYSLNARSLILPSIQSALAMIRDREEATERSTKRVNLVLQLLHQTSTGVVPSFFQGVTSHLVTLMKEKEARSHNPSNWLPDEASKPENITKAGTFRRACIQYLESRISPILAGIIAHIDTNQNLDILSGHISQGDWIAQLWLHIFNTPSAIQLQYSDLQSPGRQQELSEVIVKTTGCEGHTFQAELPFSWLIFEQIDAISRNTHESLKEKEQTVFVLERIVKIFKETPLGKLLNDFQGSMTNIMHLYTQDFINMTIKVQSDAERELVFRVILESATELLAHNPTCLLTGLVSIHEAYQHRAQHLAYFRSINQVWPECSETLKKLLEEQPNHHLFSQTLDVQGISLLLEQLNTQDAKVFSSTEGQASWMKKVFCYRPVVEQCLTLYSSHPELNFSPVVVRARQLWIRDMVLKLYIEHIGTMDRGADHFAVKNCMVLWQMLEKVVDLKQVESFKEVEKFLKICNRAAIAAFYKEQPRCPICECEVLTEGSPVTLPCSDTICLRCFLDDQSLGYHECRKCHNSIPADFVPDKAMKGSQEIKGFKDYQSRCNSFFMDVVSQLCFADNTPPSDEVVDMLLGYITMTTPSGKNRAATRQLTKELTVFNDCFDPTPVFRSFLLQLLLRTSEDRVYSNLEKYLNQAQRVMESTEGLQKEYFSQLCLLVVQCLEDHYHREAMGTDDAEFARDCLQKAGQLIRHDQPSRKLVGIAMIKFGLAVTSKYIHLAVTKASRPSNIWTLCDSAVAVCKEPCQWPKIFFIRYLCRCYGIGSYRTMCQKKDVSFLREICMENSSKTEVNEASDRYIVCGPDYTRIRDAITQVVLGEKIVKLNQAIKESALPDRWTEVFVCLALHRVITLDHIHGQAKKKSAQKAMNSLQNYCSNVKHPMNKEMIQAIIQNTYGKHVDLLTVIPGLDIQQQGVLCLLVHCDLVLRNLLGDRTLMQPLISMATHPETLKDSYLPTMPQDDADIGRAILASHRRPSMDDKHAIVCSAYRLVLNQCLPGFVEDLDVEKTLDYMLQKNVLDDVTVRDIAEHLTTSDKVRVLIRSIKGRGQSCYENFKECLILSGQNHLRERLVAKEEALARDQNNGSSVCPIGHPNITGNTQSCRLCGTQIGGTDYRPLPRITTSRQQHMTEPGHILGAASWRAQFAVPERNMSPAYCAVVRLMLHLSMILGANHNPEAICQLIKPQITPDMVVSFLMEYIQCDLNDLHRTLGRSVDDVFVMVHYILDRIMKIYNEKEQLVEEKIYGLRTKDAQLEWERKFSERFLAPVLQDLDAVLQEINQNLARDKRPGSDPLLCHLFETNTTQETISPTELQEDPSMWRYRTRITIDHLRHEFDVQMAAIRMNQNQHKALHLFLREEHHLRALRFIPSILKLHRILFQKFQRRLGRAEASSITVESVLREDWGKDLEALIQDYTKAWELVRNSLSMTMQVLQEYCRKSIDGSTPISQLLPSSSGAGLCTYSMLWFLFKKQNDFLEEYCTVQKSNSTENLPKVKVRDITPAHLISYHPEQDILPLVLANCNYSFKMAKGTTIEYNFANLERQITDRFLFGKSLIDIEIEEMVYRADFTNAATFRKLEEKIPQEPLNSGVKHKISEEFRSLPDLCQALNNLDIAISFLKSIGGNPASDLDKFMVETLKMEQSLHNASAKLYCQYRHVKSLWLLLFLEKTKILAKQKEMIFDGIPEDFHQPLTQEQRKALSDYLLPLPLKCLIPLLELMFECIVLFISVPQNPDGKDFAKETRFGYYLQEFFDDREMEVHIHLQNFPPEVLSKCCVSAWEFTYTILRDKEKSGHRH